MSRFDVKEFLQIEEFDKEHDTGFISEALTPYFKDLFKDLALRAQLKSNKINAVTFLEYCQLPGVIGDRLFAVMDVNRDGEIVEHHFIANLILIFMSDLATKLKLTFNIYDFNFDGKVSREEVRMILSYIPFEHENKSKEEAKMEGIYMPNEGRDMSY